MSARHAAIANRRLTEFKVPQSHHVVKASVKDYTKAADHARRSGAKLVTGTARHMVAHFDNKDRASQYHRALRAGGHADAALHHVRESCPTE